MVDFSFTLDGTGYKTGSLDGTPGEYSVDGYNFKVYFDYAPSSVTLTLDASLAGTEYTYVVSGYGPGSSNSDITNFVLPDGWTATSTYVGSAYGGTYLVSVYDGTSTLATTVLLSGGEFGGFTNVCFTRGAMINTPEGHKPVETLVEGDLVLTRDHGAQPIRWVGASKMSAETLAQFPDLRPIRIKAGALGDNAEQLVSPAHRMLISGWQAEALFGEAEMLASAKSLVNDRSITVAHDVAEIEYFHILFDSHEIINADGAWSESFHPAALHMGSASEATRDEVLTIFPELEASAESYGPTARPALQATDVQVLIA